MTVTSNRGFSMFIQFVDSSQLKFLNLIVNICMVFEKRELFGPRVKMEEGIVIIIHAQHP